ncbi:MAG: alpha/beta hydrolase [Humidesulfovibrio sp.]|nr:alpha/beta hydrolase [Humidesulfovibrio sp.]
MPRTASTRFGPRPVLGSCLILCLALCLFLASLCGLFPLPVANAADLLGVVLLHDKNDSPERHLAETVRLLRNVGFLVEVPEMPWSRRRGFDASYQQALVEIGISVGELRANGATQVAIVGHGLGANAAIGYAATRPGVFALVCLAPSHDPERYRDVFVADLRKAHQMILTGRGSERSAFMDMRHGKDYDLSTTAEIYLSYSDPDGLAVMPHTVEAIKPPVPLLWVAGTNDPLSRLGRSYVFSRAPEHPGSRYEEILATHTTLPAESARMVAVWLKDLLVNPVRN